jgi:hypothetical protein
MGFPRMMSGNFAAVFPMTSAAGHQYAVKCFTREAAHQLERYRLIGSYLAKIRPSWSTDFQFAQEGILVGAHWYPILRMNWVGGVTLTQWISNNIDNTGLIASLASRFDDMVQDLTRSGMAHGDLQARNLLVADNGQLHLVDYDGMYVPGLENLPPDEVGHPDYQPPGRSRGDYGLGMDRFSAWLISLSLKIIATDSTLWAQLNPDEDDYLLLNRGDLLDLNSSVRFRALAAHRDEEVRRLAQVAGVILALPLPAVPALTAPPSAKSRPPSASAAQPAGRVPGWMRDFVPGTFSVDAHARAATPEQRDNDVPMVLSELRGGRRKAKSAVKHASREIGKIEKMAGGVERSARGIDVNYSNRRASIQAGYDRRRNNVSHEVASIDRQLTQLQSARQRQVGLRLKAVQQTYVATKLSGSTIRANEVVGVGTQLVAKLWSSGIRCPADFSRVEYVRGGRYVTAYFRLSNGRRVHVPGIGEVKARRIEQWRMAQVANAVRLQPAALSASELQGIDAQFVTQERQLQEQRARVVREVSDQIAAIEQECRAALAEVDKDRAARLVPIGERRTELAAEMGRAQSDLVLARQQVLDWERLIAGTGRSGFGGFVRALIRR